MAYGDPVPENWGGWCGGHHLPFPCPICMPNVSVSPSTQSVDPHLHVSMRIASALERIADALEELGTSGLIHNQ